MKENIGFTQIIWDYYKNHKDEKKSFIE